MGEIAKTQQLAELLESFDTAMLITRHGDGDHARPMAIAEIEGASTIWFVTSNDSPKADEIRKDSRVSVIFQSERKFIALSGTSSIIRERARIDVLWKEVWKVWFPNGKTDPSIALIKVEVQDAEFWDNAGGKGIRYAFEAVKGLIKGERPDAVPGAHGRVKQDELPASSRRN
jgi:general stress protein 26